MSEDKDRNGAGEGWLAVLLPVAVALLAGAIGGGWVGTRVSQEALAQAQKIRVISLQEVTESDNPEIAARQALAIARRMAEHGVIVLREGAVVAAPGGAYIDAGPQRKAAP